MVTAPVSKERLAAIGYGFPGQTEFFAARWGGDPVMCFCGGKLRVALATWHLPFHEVPRALGPNQLRRTIAAADRLARADGVASPRIGVCGLNPHAGEGGLLGLEERDFINPTLDQLRPDFPGLSACLPGDTLFARALRGEFDVFVESSVVGMRKPDPRIYLHACEALKVTPPEAIFLDDIGSNLKAARALGMTTIKVEEPGRALAELASRLKWPEDALRG